MGKYIMLLTRDVEDDQWNLDPYVNFTTRSTRVQALCHDIILSWGRAFSWQRSGYLVEMAILLNRNRLVKRCLEESKIFGDSWEPSWTAEKGKRGVAGILQDQ